MLATAIPDVLVGDDHPAVPGRVLDHPLDEAAVGLLDVRLPGQLGLRVTEAHRQRVADPFQFSRRQHARAARGRDVPLDAAAREGRCEQLAQAALQVSDLAAQVGAEAPLSALGNVDPGRERRRPVDLIEQFGQVILLPARRLRGRF